ncbi:hypothetical protein LEMLEM_LOCUS5734 [Lemmus lemmus]
MVTAGTLSIGLPGGAAEKSTQPLADGVYVNSPTPVPSTNQIGSLLPPLVELGGDVWNVPLSQGPGAGIPPLTPSPRLHHGGKVAVASGAERTPHSEENRCPALVHSTGLGRSVPTGTKRAEPRPSSEGLPSHPTPTQDLLTTIAPSSASAQGPPYGRALQDPSFEEAQGCRVLARSRASAPMSLLCHNPGSHPSLRGTASANLGTSESCAFCVLKRRVPETTARLLSPRLLECTCTRYQVLRLQRREISFSLPGPVVGQPGVQHLLVPTCNSEF